VGLLVALSLLAGTGCGLGDYEQLMDKERARVKEFDEEYKFLGPPLNMPADATEGDVRKQPALQRIDVFLRPPKGVSNKCADKEQFKDKPANTNGMPLYRYTWGESANVFLAGEIGMPSEQFQREVRLGLRDYHEAKYKRPLPILEQPATQAPDLKPLPSRSGQLPPVRFRTQTVAEPPAADPKESPRFRYQIYYHQSGKDQVAVIYQVPLNAGEQPDVGRAINFSLRTLGVGPANSTAQRKAYVERLAYFPSKKG
jgi:hypothetical protein